MRVGVRPRPRVRVVVVGHVDGRVAGLARRPHVVPVPAVVVPVRAVLGARDAADAARARVPLGLVLLGALPVVAVVIAAFPVVPAGNVQADQRAVVVAAVLSAGDATQGSGTVDAGGDVALPVVTVVTVVASLPVVAASDVKVGQLTIV